jgi:hypothetical protein
MPAKDCDALEKDFQAVIAKLEKMHEYKDALDWIKTEHKRFIRKVKANEPANNFNDTFETALYNSYEHSFFRDTKKGEKLYAELLRIHTAMEQACSPEGIAEGLAKQAAAAAAAEEAKEKRRAAAVARKANKKAELMAAAAKIAEDEAKGTRRPKRGTRKNRKQRGGVLLYVGAALVAVCLGFMVNCTGRSGVSSSMIAQRQAFIANERRSPPGYYRFVEAKILDGTFYPITGLLAPMTLGMLKTQHGMSTQLQISSDGGRTYRTEFIGTPELLQLGVLEINPAYRGMGGGANEPAINMGTIERLVKDKAYADSQSQEDILAAFGLTAEQVTNYIESGTCPI